MNTNVLMLLIALAMVACGECRPSCGTVNPDYKPAQPVSEPTGKKPAEAPKKTDESSNKSDGKKLSFKLPSGPALSSDIKIDLLQVIKSGRAKLKDQTFQLCGTKVVTEKKVIGKGKRKCVVSIARKVNVCSDRSYLAVADVQTGKIEIVGVNSVGTSLTAEYVIERDNTYATPLRLGPGQAFKVVKPEGKIVVAAKERDGIKQKGGTVYTPYSLELDTPVVRTAGADLLRNSVAAALQQLRTHKVMSQIAHKTLVADNSLAVVPMILPIVEQFRHSLMSSVGVEPLICQNLTIFGANGGDAYRTVRSGPGARGAFQIMPRTYKSIVRLYPTAKWPASFELCTTNLVCAAKVAILLNDADLLMVPSKLRAKVAASKQGIARYLAAAYNTGGPRASRTLIAYKGQWEWAANIPHPEARMYVVKTDAIWSKVIVAQDVAAAN